MKGFALFFAAIIAVSLGSPLSDEEIFNYKPKKLGIKITELTTQDSLDDFLAALQKFIKDGDVGDIFNVELNPLVSNLLDNVRSAIIQGGMDPLQLDDQTLQLLGIVGSIKLTSGWLQDISTIARDGDVITTYNSATKKVTFSLPLSFKVLLFTFKYVTRVTLLSISGDVQGKIDDVELNVKITFDPASRGFILDSVNMNDSGKITVKFTGNGLVDWLTNAMTSVITTILHPWIIWILEINVKGIGSEILAVVNEYIQDNI